LKEGSEKGGGRGELREERGRGGDEGIEQRKKLNRGKIKKEKENEARRHRKYVDVQCPQNIITNSSFLCSSA